MLSAINDQDPALWSVAFSEQLVKTRTLVTLDRDQFEQRLSPWNMSVVRLEPIEPLSMGGHAPEQNVLPGFPVRVNTGDPAADEADYQQRKAQ